MRKNNSELRAQLARCVEVLHKVAIEAENIGWDELGYDFDLIKPLLDSLPKTASLDAETNDKINVADFLTPIVDAVCKELNSHPETLIEDVKTVAEVLRCAELQEAEYGSVGFDSKEYVSICEDTCLAVRARNEVK